MSNLAVFSQYLNALEGKQDKFSFGFLLWLRDVVNRVNADLTFEEVRAALEIADAEISFNGVALTDIGSLYTDAGSEPTPALVIGALVAGGGMYSTSNTLYWTTNGATRMRLNGGNLFVYGAIGTTNGQVFQYGTGNGVLKLSNSTDNDFNRLQLGGDTSSFPSLKKDGVGLRARLADDSADTFFAASFAKLTPGAAPSSPTEGMVYANSTDHKLYFYNGTTWVDLTA